MVIVQNSLLRSAQSSWGHQNPKCSLLKGLSPNPEIFQSKFNSCVFHPFAARSLYFVEGWWQAGRCCPVHWLPSSRHRHIIHESYPYILAELQTHVLSSSLLTEVPTWVNISIFARESKENTKQKTHIGVTESHNPVILHLGTSRVYTMWYKSSRTISDWLVAAVSD